MTVSGVDSVASKSNIHFATEENGTMGKDDFLQLLVTQMQNQDPLNPMDNSEFASQLAQFSSLEQMTNVNTNLEAMLESQKIISSNQSVAFIGKSVRAEGRSLEMGVNGIEDIHFDLEQDANVTVYLYDGSGSLVRSITAGRLGIGEQTVAWDGKDQDGNLLSDGRYSFEISAVSADGSPVGVEPFILKKIDAIGFDSGESVLISGETKIASSQIQRIVEPSE